MYICMCDIICKSPLLNDFGEFELCDLTDTLMKCIVYQQYLRNNNLQQYLYTYRHISIQASFQGVSITR